MAKQDFYKTLGVEKGASPEDIKKAYRKLAKECHPDKNAGDKAAEQKFKDLNEAYDVLKDPEKRAAYDHFGHQAFERGGFGPGGFAGAGGRPGFDFHHTFSDVFEDLFGEFMGGMGAGPGRRGARPAARRGQDVRVNLAITLEEAFHGKEAEVTVSTPVACEDCHGTGAKAGSKPATCPECHGSGRQRLQQGFFMMERTCARCNGAGQVISDPCAACHGSGRVSRRRTLSVKIPKGVEDGTRIRLSGEGEAGVRGGPAGDLYIFVSIAPHKIFRRQGETLFCRVPLPMTTAVLGGEIEVPTIEGSRARVKIPEGTQNGRQFRLKGKGMPVLNAGRIGDMIIEVAVETPVNLSRQQKEHLKKFEQAGEGRSWSPEAQGFFSRIREFWDDLTE
jgi:molecular chaperone DnaJ